MKFNYKSLIYHNLIIQYQKIENWSTIPWCKLNSSNIQARDANNKFYRSTQFNILISILRLLQQNKRLERNLTKGVWIELHPTVN